MEHLISLSIVADATNASQTMRTFINPLVTLLGILAGLVATGYLVNGGIRMMTSTGKPDQLAEAKIIIRNALIGLVVVIASVTLTSILTSTYQSTNAPSTTSIPKLETIKPNEKSDGIVNVLIDSTIGLLKNIIETVATPFISALNYFTTKTPLMAENTSVFNLWLIILAIANVLLILVIILLGFNIMSGPSLGFDELEFKHMIPQLIVVFIVMNSSIFIVDIIINLSNWMIQSFQAGFESNTVWRSLSSVADSNIAGMQLAALLIFIIFIILSVILIIYYILRLVTLYIGVVLSPLLLLLWLLPGFKDFAVTALRTYITTIFILFIHTVILAIAASILLGMSANNTGTLDPIMSMLVGIATILSLLKTQSVVSQLAIVSTGSRAMRKLGGQFINGASSLRTHSNTNVAQSRHVQRMPTPSVTYVIKPRGEST